MSLGALAGPIQSWLAPTGAPSDGSAPTTGSAWIPEIFAPRGWRPQAGGHWSRPRAERVRGILADAGWEAIEIEPLDVDGALSVHDLAVYATRMGSVGQMLQGLEEPVRGAVVETVMRSFDPFTRDGVANFVMAGWRVTARA